MDAKQIARIDIQKASQTQQRSRLSNQHSEQGFDSLSKALETSVLAEQKPLFLQACDAFAESIRFQRSNPEPYIGFAYVLMLIGSPEKAQGYVKEAQRLQPDHEDIPLLLAELKDRAESRQREAKARAAEKRALSVAGLTAESAEAEIDYDALYDRLELEIMAEIKALMTAPLVEAKTAIESAHIARLEQQIKAIKKQLAHFEQQLTILDEEIDTVELRVKLKLIEGLLRRFRQAWQASGTLASLCQEIAEQYRLVHQTLQETRLSTDPEDVAIVEENLEVFLDRIDHFANGLDQLESQGHGIDAGLQRYNKLLAVLEDLQDALDDLKSRFGPS